MILFTRPLAIRDWKGAERGEEIRRSHNDPRREAVCSISRAPEKGTRHVSKSVGGVDLIFFPSWAEKHVSYSSPLFFFPEKATKDFAPSSYSVVVE